MPITVPTKTDDSIGRELRDRPRKLPADLRYEIPAATMERIKDLLIAYGVAITDLETGGAASGPVKSPVRVATTVAGTLGSSFQNGSVVNGVTLATGDRILIKDQVDPTENGIYTVNASGAPTRAADMLAGDNVAGILVFAQEGSSDADRGWECTTDEPNDEVGTDALAFAAIAGVGSGDVTGPAGATDNAFARFNGTGGKDIQDSQTTEDDSGNVSVTGVLTAILGMLIGQNATGFKSAKLWESGVGTEPVGTPNIAQLYAKEAAGGTTELYGFNSSGSSEQITGPEVVPNNHASRHEPGGADEIDLLVRILEDADAISTSTETVSDGTYDNAMTECDHASGCTVTINGGRPAGTMLMFWASVASQTVTLVAGTGGISFEPLNGKTLVSQGQGHAVGVLFLTTTRCLRIGSFGAV